jgi:uncharacterized membrane protein
MKLSYLVRGLPGHPHHPPLTDATIGSYTAATAFSLLSALDVSSSATATAWWLSLLIGLIVSLPTALTGLIEWLTIDRGTRLWQVATAHLFAMVTATVFFLLAAIFGHHGYDHRTVSTGALILTLVGYGLLTLGGWIGGGLVFTHGMRVLRSADPTPQERNH